MNHEVRILDVRLKSASSMLPFWCPLSVVCFMVSATDLYYSPPHTLTGGRKIELLTASGLLWLILWLVDVPSAPLRLPPLFQFIATTLFFGMNDRYRLPLLVDGWVGRSLELRRMLLLLKVLAAEKEGKKVMGSLLSEFPYHPWLVTFFLDSYSVLIQYMLCDSTQSLFALDYQVK